MKTILYAVSAILITTAAASATPYGERASTKAPAPAERNVSREMRDSMPVGLERDFRFEKQQPSRVSPAAGGWTGNHNEG